MIDFEKTKENVVKQLGWAEMEEIGQTEEEGGFCISHFISEQEEEEEKEIGRTQFLMKQVKNDLQNLVSDNSCLSLNLS